MRDRFFHIYASFRLRSSSLSQQRAEISQLSFDPTLTHKGTQSLRGGRGGGISIFLWMLQLGAIQKFPAWKLYVPDSSSLEVGFPAWKTKEYHSSMEVGFPAWNTKEYNSSMEAGLQLVKCLTFQLGGGGLQFVKCLILPLQHGVYLLEF